MLFLRNELYKIFETHFTMTCVFFEKNLRRQFDIVFDSESNGGIFKSLAPLGGKLWLFEIFKFGDQPT